MANPYTDPRYQMARMMRAQSQGSPVTPLPNPSGGISQSGVNLGRTASDMANSMPNLKASIEAIAQGRSQGKPSGIMGMALGNPIAKTALNALSVFAIPGKATVSAVREFVDAVDNNASTKASFSNFVSQTKDPHFGFGKAFHINTGHKWIDRAIGFAGDIALDPLTYATFGAGKFAGYAGRQKLAFEVLKNTGDEALATSVSRMGRRALIDHPDVLERVGANKMGVYMFGKRIKVGVHGEGLRVPMTGHIAELGETTLSMLRTGITDTRLGKYIQRMSMDKDMLPARLALAQGELSPRAGANVIRMMEARPAQRAARAAALQSLEHEVLSVIKSEQGIGDLETYRKTLYKYLERPDLLPEATAAEQRAYNVWKSWFDDKINRVNLGIKEIDPEGQIRMVENYFPRTVTDDGMKFVRGSGSPHAQELRQIFIDDPLASPDAFTPRSLRPGKKFFGHTLTAEDMNIESLNDIARKGGFTGDFFETDIVNASKKYIQDVADELGIIERNRILKDTGFFDKIKEQRMRTTEVDEDAVRMARERVDTVRTSYEGAVKAHTTAMADVVTTLRSEAKAIGSGLKSTDAGIQALTKKIDDAMRVLAGHENNIIESRNSLLVMFGAMDNQGVYHAGYAPETLQPVLDNFDELTAELSKVRAEMNKYAEQVVQPLRAENFDMQAAATNLENVAAEAQKKMDIIVRSNNQAIEYGNALQSVWENLINGKVLSGSGDMRGAMNELRGILGTRNVTPSKARAAQLAGAGVKADFTSWKNSQQFKDFMSAWQGANEAKISESAIKRMTPEVFDDLMTKALTNDASLYDARVAAMYAMARDMHMYGDDLPEMLKPYRAELEAALSRANKEHFVSLRRASKGGSGRASGLDLFEQQWAQEFQQASYIMADIKSKSDFLKIADAALASEPDMLLEKFTEQHADTFQAALESIGPMLARRGENIDSKNFTFLYDYLDEPMLSTGIEEPTVGDVIDAVRKRMNVMETEFNTPRFDMDESNLKRGTDIISSQQKSFKDIYNEYHTLRRGELSKGQFSTNPKVTVGTGKEAETLSISGTRTGMSEEARLGLSLATLKYTAISDAIGKFEAVSNALAVHGLVPTEEMWRGILRTTKSQYGAGLTSKMDNLSKAEDLMASMRSVFNERITSARKASEVEVEALRKRKIELGEQINALVDGGVAKNNSRLKRLNAEYAQIDEKIGAAEKSRRVNASQIFENVLAEHLSSEDGQALRELLGPTMSNMLDPVQMRERIKVLRAGRVISHSEKNARIAILERQLAEAKGAAISQIRARLEKLKNVESFDDVLAAKGKQAYKAYMEETVYPWLKQVNPGAKKGYDAVKRALDAQVAGWGETSFKKFATPLHPEADEVVIGKWFRNFFDETKTTTSYEQYLPAKARAEFNYDMLSPEEQAAVMTAQGATRLVRYQSIIPGKISGLRRQMQDSYMFFERMGDGYLNPAEFIRNPNVSQHTPSSYGMVLRMHARSLEASLAEGTDEVIGLSTLKAEKIAGKVADTAVAEAKNAKVAAERAAKIQAAYENPYITNATLKKYGFTEEMLASRQAHLKHTRIRTTSGFAKAEQDAEIVRFLDAAAGHDFSKFDEGIVIGYRDVPNSAENIAAGGMPTRSQPVFATMPDGSRIIFSRGEWSSLFRKQLSPLEIKTLRAQRADLFEQLAIVEDHLNLSDVGMRFRSDIDNLNAAYSSHLAEIDDINKELANIERLRNKGGGINQLRHDELTKRLSVLTKNVKSIEERLSPKFDDMSILSGDIVNSYKKQAEELRKQILEKEDILLANDVKTRASALEKARILVHGHETQTAENRAAEWINSETTSVLTDGRGRKATWQNVAHVNNTPVRRNATLSYYTERAARNQTTFSSLNDLDIQAARRSRLVELWNATPEAKLIAEEKKLARSTVMYPWKRANRDVELLQRAAEKANQVADNATQQFDDIQMKIWNTLSDMHNAEYAAAKSAGAEFVGQTPRGVMSEKSVLSKTSGFTYRLNGKEYVVPSIDDMWQNPERFVRQFRKRGELFENLRKGGPVFESADSSQRASMALAATMDADFVAGHAVLARNFADMSAKRVDEAMTVLNGMATNSKSLSTSLNSLMDVLKEEARKIHANIADSEKGALSAKFDIFELNSDIKAMYGDSYDVSNVVPMLETRASVLKKRQDILTQIFADAPTGAIRTAKKADTVARLTREYRQWMFQNKSLMEELVKTADDETSARILDAWSNASAAEGRFLTEQLALSSAERELARVATPREVERILQAGSDEFAKASKTWLEQNGMRQATGFNMPGHAIDKETHDIIGSIGRMQDAKVLREMAGFIGPYTRFFKAYATLTPGFHVRNSISNAFQMFAAGADVANMRNGLKLYQSMGEHLRAGGNLESWLESLAKKGFKADEIGRARIAANTSLALGGGQVSSAFDEFLSGAKRSVLTDNFATRASHSMGHKVEGSARFMLAYDSAVKGMDFTQSFNRTSRFLFDYNNPKLVDDAVKNIIPFWTWMSRNLPLQLANMWVNPKAYLKYKHFAINFAVSENDNIPQYMRDQGALHLGGNTYLSPDLPFTKLNEQIAEFGQPRRLLSYVNPAIRLPMELAGNTKFYNNQQFRGKYLPITGRWKVFQPLLEAMGQVKYDNNGNPVMTEKAMYALTSSIPTLGQAERLFPSSDASGSSDAAKFASYMGIPMRTVNQDMRKSVDNQKVAQLKALMDEQKRINQQ